MLGCLAPACYLEVHAAPATTNVAATLIIPDHHAARPIAAAASDFIALPPAAISTSLGVDVVARYATMVHAGWRAWVPVSASGA